MPDTTAWGCVQRYVMPRNPAVPDMGLREVVGSEPLSTNGKGQIVGDAVPVWRGNSPKLTVWSMLAPGTQYPFRLGWLYVKQGPSSASEVLFEGARGAAMLAVPGIGEMAGPFSDLAEEVAHGLIENVHTGKEKLKGTAADVISELERRGALCCAGVDLVEVAYHLDPPSFLHRKERHRCVLTYERRDGKRTSYTMAWRGPNGRINVTGMIAEQLAARRDGEFGQLVYLVMAEHVNFKAVFQSKLDEYKQRYGSELGSHWTELQTDVGTACAAELERVGFTEQQGAAIALERLAPLIPHYEQVPVLKDAVEALRAMANGGATTA